MKRNIMSTLILLLLSAVTQAAEELPDGWQTVAPRDEIRPAFSFEPKGGPKHAGSLVVTHDHRDGLDGWFQKSFAVSGGEFYRFHAVRKTQNVSVPRRSALVRVLWQNEAGHMVSADVPEQPSQGAGPRAQRRTGVPRGWRDQCARLDHGLRSVSRTRQGEASRGGAAPAMGSQRAHGVERCAVREDHAAAASQGAAGHDSLPADGQIAAGELRGICAAAGGSREAEGRSRRAR